MTYLEKLATQTPSPANSSLTPIALNPSQYPRPHATNCNSIEAPSEGNGHAVDPGGVSLEGAEWPEGQSPRPLPPSQWPEGQSPRRPDGQSPRPGAKWPEGQSPRPLPPSPRPEIPSGACLSTRVGSEYEQTIGYLTLTVPLSQFRPYSESVVTYHLAANNMSSRDIARQDLYYNLQLLRGATVEDARAIFVCNRACRRGMNCSRAYYHTICGFLCSPCTVVRRLCLGLCAQI